MVCEHTISHFEWALSSYSLIPGCYDMIHPSTSVRILRITSPESTWADHVCTVFDLSTLVDCFGNLGPVMYGNHKHGSYT